MDTAAIIAQLSNYTRLPVAAMRAAAENREALLPECLRLVEAAAAGRLVSERERAALLLMFHLLGEWREQSAYRPLARMLSTPNADDILDDAITVTAHRVMAGVFDGDPRPLYDVILDERADQFVRAALFETVIAVTLDGRLPRSEATRFLVSCFSEMQPRLGCFAWSGWQLAIAMLGLAELKPLVRQAFERGSIEAMWMSYEDFEEDLDYALAHPDAPNRSEPDRFQPLDDVVGELSRWYGFSPAYFEEERRRVRHARRSARLASMAASPEQPVLNPARDVGRNDPCPCGSGKKYKKCCLN